jgi:uncharacterized protein YyaL (SSP411 family)
MPDPSAAHSTNRLIHEISPYLLQHAHNPVDWYPWSEAAFARAREEDKPIFLSIGYSSCHWCHVMEHESFDNQEIAEVLNQHFIAVKVDREQRPDVDHLYMNAVQMMTGAGGWPLSVFLTPDRRAFYGGTYFPPADGYGRPGFKRLLLTIADAWKERREELLSSATRLHEALSQDAAVATGPADASLLTATYQAACQAFDEKNGGFGRAPKFPQPAILALLLRVWQRTEDAVALAAVTQTLDAMARGGIYDHLGGGFHRYATDAAWHVPHFEKMLYDQAQLAQVYLDGYKVTGDPAYARTVRAVTDYVLRDMTDVRGGFYSAEDADSEGREGAFYVWTAAQIQGALPADTAQRFMDAYGVTVQGNFEHGTSILYARQPYSASLVEARRILTDLRARRIRPFRDEKIITAWNGMMIASLADSARILEEPRYVDAAVKAAAFVLEEMRVEGRLQRSWLREQCSGPAFLDDYAFFIQGLLALYEATFTPRWLLAADDLCSQMLDLFADVRGGALYLAGRDAESLPLRDKPQYDGALPSGNAVAAMVLYRLGRLSGKPQYRQHALGIVEQAVPQWRDHPLAHVALAAALDFDLGPTREITLAGDLDSAPGVDMVTSLYRMYRPNTLLIHRPLDDTAEVLDRLAPYARAQVAIDNVPTAYVCENAACRIPVQDVQALAALLGPARRPLPGSEPQQ